MRFIYTKAFGFFALCLLIISVLVFLNSFGWLSPTARFFLKAPKPVIYVVKKVASPLKNIFFTIYQLHKITDENTELENKINTFRQQLVDYEQEKKENEALRKELNFAKNTSLQLLPCSVLSENIFGSPEIIVLDCGADKGVVEGEAVVSQGYLAGKIVYAGANSSTALLAVGSQFSTDAKLSKSGSDGVIKGSFGSGIILDQLSQTVAVEKGSIVVTGGINDKIPRNILIGEVGEEISNPNDLFKKTTILSPINFNNLDFVFVVKP